MDKLINKVSDLVSDSKDALKDSFDKISKLSEATKEKTADYVNQLIEFMPVIEEIGFKATSISVNMGIPPSAVVKFKKIKQIEESQKESILAEHKDSLILMMIIKTLLTADQFQNSIKMGSFSFESIDVNLGLAPGVNIQLEPKT